jgi:hypothetical protein
MVMGTGDGGINEASDVLQLEPGVAVVQVMVTDEAKPATGETVAVV